VTPSSDSVASPRPPYLVAGLRIELHAVTPAKASPAPYLLASAVVLLSMATLGVARAASRLGHPACAALVSLARGFSGCGVIPALLAVGEVDRNFIAHDVCRRRRSRRHHEPLHQPIRVGVVERDPAVRKLGYHHSRSFPWCLVDRGSARS